MAIRTLRITGFQHEDETPKAYRVNLDDGRTVSVPKRGVLDAVPRILVVTEWCYRVVDRQRRKAG